MCLLNEMRASYWRICGLLDTHMHQVLDSPQMISLGKGGATIWALIWAYRTYPQQPLERHPPCTIPSHWQSQWRCLLPYYNIPVQCIRPPMKGREVREHKVLNRQNSTQSKLHVCTQLASKTCKASKTPYDTPPNMIAPKYRWPA